ncbi:uncharacterized protein LOC134088050 [Sardina pilchardus]|uniref:uncharacterized protein LOC134088050 n=1 Tax=Sardina pilchardus TaxID=27697 RepID=UPI002E0DB175
MGSTTSTTTTTKAPTTTATTTTTQAAATTTTAIAIQTTTTTSYHPHGLSLEYQLVIAFSCVTLLLILALSSAAIYIFCWRKLPISVVTAWLTGSGKAEASDVTETPETINQRTYENVGTLAKQDVEPDVLYSEVSSIKSRHSVVVVLPDTATEYATVKTSSI